MFGMTRIPDFRQTSQHVRKVPRMSIWQGSPHVIMTIASSGNSIKSAMSHMGQTEEISITNFFGVTAESGHYSIQSACPRGSPCRHVRRFARLSLPSLFENLRIENM